MCLYSFTPTRKLTVFHSVPPQKSSSARPNFSHRRATQMAHEYLSLSPQASKSSSKLFPTTIGLPTIGVLLLLLLFSQLRWNENMLDLKFFLGIHLPFRLHRAALEFRQGGRLPERTVEVRENCTGLSVLPFQAQHPVLFKNCISRNATVEDFVLFEESRQNLFPACEGQKLLRHFEYESYGGEKKPIVEDVPCDTTTLREKLDAFHKHQLFDTDASDDSTTDSSEDRSYFEVHTYFMSTREKREMERHIMGLMQTPMRIGLVDQMLPAATTMFLHAGRSAVYYLHAHMDHFLSFCLSEEKTWLLIDPMHSDAFDSVWSGNAQVQLREKEPNVPRLVVTQEKGDILFVPPWWLHETMVKRKAKNIGFNLHFGVRGQLSMEVANLFRFDPSFFYSWVKQIKPELFEKKTRLGA